MSLFEPGYQRLWHKLAEVSTGAPPVVTFGEITPCCEGCGMHRVALSVGSASLVIQITPLELFKLANAAEAKLRTPHAHCRRDTCPPPLRIGGVA